MVWLLALLAGCGQAPCALDADVVPGCGVRTDAGEVRIGDDRGALDGGIARDLGALGVRVGHGEFTVSYVDDRVDAVQLHAGFAGATSGGVEIGATEARVTSELGEPVVDLFSDTWWFREQGVALRFDDGVVAGITVF